VKKFLKWQTPFEPLMSKYLDIKNERGEEVAYKGPMAKRMMPPPAAAYQSLNPKDSLAVKVDVLKGYALTQTGKYTVTYTSENVSGLKVRQSVTFIYK
ncbi:MAG: protease, partial [Bacteroidota bacterium]|nr:protease [Bacteroidota bacterium]